LARSDRRATGLRGEEAALEFLSRRGLDLIARNYRCRMGEIDLVMRERNVLVLVEVRVRRSFSHGGAAGSIGAAKQRRLITAARHLLARRRDLARLPARFDVIAMDSDSGEPDAIDWIRDAFRLAAD
jgi:putative endonuclease